MKVKFNVDSTSSAPEGLGAQELGELNVQWRFARLC
jgi:hypothetical protein